MRTGWIELAVIPAALLVVHLARSSHWTSSHLRRAWTWLKAWARLAPFTATLWLLVAVHAWMLIGLPTKVQHEVLITHSTTLSRLQREPLTVLFGSAMWTDVGELLFMTATAVIYLAPLERWIGTRRTLLAFLTGHIGATLLVAVWIEATVKMTKQQEITYSRTIDVGVSYGAYCCAALLAYRLRMPWRLTIWILLFSYLLYQASLTDFDAAVDYTPLGHLTAFGLGLLCYPLSRGPRARERRSDPWIRIPAGAREPARTPRSTSAFRTVERAKDNEPEVISTDA